MTTIDNIMAMADKYASQWENSYEYPTTTREALRTALTEALAQQSQTTGCTSNCDNCIYAHGSPAHAGYCYAFYKEPQGVCAQWKDASLTNDGTKAQPVREPLSDKQIELAYRDLYRNEEFGQTTYEMVEAGIRYAEKHHGIGGDK